MARRASDDTPSTWQIWIDTGGTFTDCLARDPAGGIHRAKVLSTSALRGRITRQIDGLRFVIQQHWGACDDLIGGFKFRLLGGENGSDSPVGRVARFRSAESIIELEREWSGPAPEGGSFEVRSDEPAPILAARLVTSSAAGTPLPPIAMRLATTRGTNALLERRGAPAVLFITEGFGDLLDIGDQQRPDLFALRINKPTPLHARVVEVRERLSADGSVLIPLDVDHLTAEAQRLVRGPNGLRVAAVVLMHSHTNPRHEMMVEEALRKAGFEDVSRSSALAPLIRILPRAQTTVVNACLSPIVWAHMQEIEAAARGGGRDRDQFLLHIMTSAGGLVRSDAYRACDSLLSGPAGGVAGAAAVARRSGFLRVIGFDMGGTSTDVARHDGDFEYRFEHSIGGVRLLAPALAIETVAAGGGSICAFADERLEVGPRSAGAWPGPACYGAGGPLTLTDVNLLLGRLDSNQFEIPIDAAAAGAAATTVHRAFSAGPSTLRRQTSLQEMLQGFLDIANDRMAAAIETVSVRQGYDPVEYALVAFGGAGGQHACAVADRLGVTTVIMPAEASLLSALGLGEAAIERFSQRQVLQRLDRCIDNLPRIVAELAASSIDVVVAEGVERPMAAVRRIICDLRLVGQDSTLSIDLIDMAAVARLPQLFAERYASMYGHHAPMDRPIEVESVRVVASSAGPQRSIEPEHTRPVGERRDGGRRSAWFGGGWVETMAIDRSTMAMGERVVGPALVLDRRSACIIEPGWTAQVDAAGALIARRDRQEPRLAALSDSPAAVELFANRLASIADDMGQMLQRTAISTNVKERLDFSCALLDSAGELVVNAPHIPVHLGSLGVCVRAVKAELPMEPGDVVITNQPAFGGSHLPDVTVITPIHDDDDRLIGYAASRAHHAEIGGTRPGSMPPAATTLVEEGVVIAPRHLVRGGLPRFDELERLLRESVHPSRSVGENLADVRAAVAANQRGAAAVQRLAREIGTQRLHQHMKSMTDRAERLMRDAIRQIRPGRYLADEKLDDGSPLRVAIDVRDDGSIALDFTGSAAQHKGNLNATPAIVRSAVMYVLRLLIGERLPLNEGILRAAEVRLPPGMLNPTFDLHDSTKSPAVVGGNTETSQRVVDLLIKALGLSACSQGTMNNVLFGNQRLGYYETICGGAGAGPGFDGASAVHTHMTNTRITDPEIIEHRYPVRVERFAIRRGSGGAGRYRGGDGVIRELRFLEPMAISVLSQHRRERPYGMNGGEPGASGSQRIIRASGEVVELGSIDGCDAQSGDRLMVETPGGGGFGSSA